MRGKQEIAAGTGYDLDEVLAEADTLLKDEGQRESVLRRQDAHNFLP